MQKVAAEVIAKVQEQVSGNITSHASNFGRLHHWTKVWRFGFGAKCQIYVFWWRISFRFLWPLFSRDGAYGFVNDGLQQKPQAEAVAEKKDDEEVDEDIDDYIEEVQGQRSLFILGMRNPVRRAAIAVVEWVYFDVFIFSVIALNVIFMAVDDPVNPAPSALRIAINSAGSYFFMAVFSLECLIKIVAMGFIIGKKAYLRDMWNVLDFFIVITGLIDLISDQSSVGQSSGSTFDAFRPLRLLRPLRTLRAVGRFKKLRVTVSLFSSCLPKLVQVGYLQIFIFFLFGTIACQLWQGLLRGRCYSHVTLPSFQICKFNSRALAIHSCLVTQPHDYSLIEADIAMPVTHLPRMHMLPCTIRFFPMPW
jgi:hypothetical protein